MYERMLNKQETPSIEEMTAYCGGTAKWFTLLNERLSNTYETAEKIVFPYGNNYGWGIAHRVRSKLICNIFPEDGAFTVMIRLSDKQFSSIYGQMQEYTKRYIDHRHPCGDGGWIQYRVTCGEHFDDIKKILDLKFSGTIGKNI